MSVCPLLSTTPTASNKHVCTYQMRCTRVAIVLEFDCYKLSFAFVWLGSGYTRAVTQTAYPYSTQARIVRSVRYLALFPRLQQLVRSRVDQFSALSKSLFSCKKILFSCSRLSALNLLVGTISSTPNPPFSIVLGPDQANALPSCSWFSWNTRNAPWTDDVGDQEPCAIAVRQWCAVHDTSSDSSANKDIKAFRGMILQSQLYGTAKIQVYAFNDAVLCSEHGVEAIADAVYKIFSVRWQCSLYRLRQAARYSKWSEWNIS